MSVYVDEAKHKFGRMIMCHMFADTAQELHEMADAIGVERKWYQVADGPHRASFTHYDIAKAKRARAIELGAIEVGRRQGWLIRKEIRETIKDDPAPWRYKNA